MITPNALAPDVSLPPMAAINPEATAAPTPKFDDDGATQGILCQAHG
jgi:hypothetical protein